MTTRLTQRARDLRRQSTDAEKLLWRYLQAKQLGVKFRRQAPIGHYIVDFACFSHKLIIELDGGQHAQPRQQWSDRQRDAWLQEQGFTVLRFWNNDVLRNIEGVGETIRQAMQASLLPPPQSPPQGGEGARSPLSLFHKGGDKPPAVRG